jgi:uncharacterized protein YlxW (UPF0749 family)
MPGWPHRWHGRWCRRKKWPGNLVFVVRIHGKFYGRFIVNAKVVRIVAYIAILVVVGGIIGAVWYVKGPMEEKRKEQAKRLADEESKPLEDKMQLLNKSVKELQDELAKKTEKFEKSKEGEFIDAEAKKLKKEYGEKMSEIDGKIAELDKQISAIRKKHSE